MKIIIADDHPLIASGLKSVIKEHSAYDVVATADNGRELLHLLNGLKCDIIILDINMPLMSGPEAAAEIKKRFPLVKILCISMQFDATLLRNLKEIGVDGFLPKNISPHLCLDAIRTILGGQTYFHTAISDHPLMPTDASSIALTPKEREIITLVKQGKTSKEISDILDNSTHTINTHRKNICQKLGIKEPNALVKFLLENPGLVEGM